MTENLLKDAGINNGTRKVTLRGTEVVVPLTFDEDGEISTLDKTIFKRVNRNDLRFLVEWRKSDYTRNVTVLAEKTGLPISRVEWFVKKLMPFADEDARTKVICNIPTIDHIKARLYTNSYTDELSDGQRDSLKELTKIEGGYKNQLNVSVTQNVFNLPKYDPATEAKLKEIADREADIIQEAQIVSVGG